MSTIIVVRKKGYAAIATDTLTKQRVGKESAEYVLNHQKICQIHGSYIAVVGATSAKLMLQNYFSSLEVPPDLTSVNGIFQAWLDLHAALKERYFLNPDEDEDDTVESTRMDVLIMNSFGIFGVSAHRAVQEFSRFYAYGQGREYATGAMYAVYNDPNTSAEDVARLGIVAAAEFDDSTGLPILSHVVKLRETP
jgi:ATP-dependent HslUV protease subunit HslV